MKALVHRLVPHTEDVEAYHQGTLLVLACFLTGLFAAGFAALDAALGQWAGAVSMGVAAVLFVLLPPLFQRTGAVDLVAHLFLSLGATVVVANAHVTGGAAVLAWLAILPLAAVLILDSPKSMAWGVVSVGLAALFVVLEARGHDYPAPPDGIGGTVWAVAARAGLPLLVYWLALAFCGERAKALATIRQQSDRLRDALGRLEEAKDQLVQQEKLAALGQVTAGVAHEVKNPLNFVINFSSLNGELVGELRTAVEAGDLGEVVALADEIGANAARVHEHGQRADAIVRSMATVASREPSPRRRVGLNALVADAVARAAAEAGPGAPLPVEEAYDGLAGTVDVAPEEVERAVRHVVGNAIDAAREAAPRVDGPPRVRVETVAEDDRVLIRVRDNGPGIPEALQGRVFEPFYTTKQDGQRTGLGLALAHDVVVLRHGGQIVLDSIERAGTMVTIALPAPARLLPVALGAASQPETAARGS